MTDFLSTDSFFNLFDVLITVMVIGYGIKYYNDPPKMRDGKGFRMKFMMTNEEVFRYGNRMAGLMCIALGVIIGILTAVKYFFIKDSVFELVFGGIEIALVVVLYFALKYVVIKKYGKPTSNPYDKKKK